MPLNRKPITNQTSRFYNKFICEVLPTPYTKNRNKGILQQSTDACPLCEGPKADLAHIMLDCTHEDMKKRREILDVSIRKLIINKRNTLSGKQELFQHPTGTIDQNTLYPYTNGMPKEGIGYHLEGLPESRLYRQSNTILRLCDCGITEQRNVFVHATMGKSRGTHHPGAVLVLVHVHEEWVAISLVVPSGYTKMFCNRGSDTETLHFCSWSRQLQIVNSHKSAVQREQGSAKQERDHWQAGFKHSKLDDSPCQHP